LTRNIKLVIRYDGTHYSGWQFQKNAKTVQECIESALKRITGRKVKLTGAGRTDSGVHAFHQVANFKTNSKHAPNKIKDALNSSLAEDILVVCAEYVPLKFDAQRSARSKHYRYTVTTARFTDPFMRHFAARYSYPLNFALMRRAAKILVGRHDFKSFRSSDGRELNTVRNIKNIKIEKRGDLVYIDICADGFLYNMVRIISGTLLEIGRGKISVESMREILLKRDRRSAGPTAPSKGLCLMSVEY
jgi:pseudouridylate synthase I